MNTYALIISTDSSQLEKLQKLVAQARSITFKKFIGDKEGIEGKIVGLTKYMIDESEDDETRES